MTPDEILSHVRTLIQEHAQGDPNRWWYANRYVFARLMLDERKTKAGVKKRLIEASKPCHGCGKPFLAKKGIAIHRLDGGKGYSDANCVLMHGECHERLHAEGPQQEPQQASGEHARQAADAVLVRQSKRYDGSFLYWWDIPPNLATALDRYEAVAFACKDTRVTCIVPVAELRRFLTSNRQTSRGQGNWGIKVLKGHEDELAFEPETGRKDWLFLPVDWMEEEEG